MDRYSWEREEHGLSREAARRFFESEYVPNLAAYRAKGSVDRELWLKAGKAGLMGVAMSEVYGGAGGDRMHDAIVTEELARTGDISLGILSHNVVMQYVAHYGTEDQKSRWLPGMISGELIAAIGFSEPGGGTDLQMMKTTAILEGDQYRVNGSKTFISNGLMCDLLLLVCKTDPTQRSRGVSLLMIETNGAEGFQRGRQLKKLGLDGQDTMELFFSDMMTPAGNIIGLEPGCGFYQLMEQISWERLMIALISIGYSDYALRHTIEYVKERKLFNQRLMDFQNTRFKLAESKTKLELMRAFVDTSVVKLQRGELENATGAMAKWWSSQAQCEIVDDCLQLFGGYGFMEEYPLAHLYRDGRVQKIYGGANELMKELIARSLDI